MDIPPNLPALTSGVGQRRNEDIALDLMKFIAANTEIGKASVGFQTASGGVKAQDNADKLLELYSRCLKRVQGASS